MFTTIRGALIGALALVLLIPAAANAETFNVSRDVGVYADANVSRGLGVIEAGKPVNVQCWTNGQPIQGYPIWDRITFNGRIAYVHDKYVEMGGGSPQANGIPNCNSGGQPPAQPKPTPKPARCVTAGTWVQYLADVDPASEDAAGNHYPESWDSPFRVKWAPKFCPRGNSGDYTISGTPEIREMGPYGLILNLEPGEGVESPDGRRITYTPRLRACPAGICFTAARVRLLATLTGGGVRIDRSVETLDGWRSLEGNFFGWRHKDKQHPR
jgi:hypothetical protein